MPPQAARCWVSMVSSTAIYLTFFLFTWGPSQAVGTDAGAVLQFWGTATLILIPVFIVGQVLVLILHSIFRTILTRRADEWTSDELVREIELRASRLSYYAFGLSFVVAALTQALGWSPAALFVSLLVGSYVSQLVSDITQVIYLRRGL